MICRCRLLSQFRECFKRRGAARRLCRLGFSPRDHLAQARARLEDAPSALASMSPEDRERLTSYEGPEVSGSMRSKHAKAER